MKNSKVLLLTLRTFSLTGGIEKVSQTFTKTLDDLKSNGELQSYQVLSMYDDQADPKYVPKNHFKGFNGNRFAFGLAAIKQGLKANILVISHAHLLIFAKIIRQLKPSIRIVLFAHGIEIWNVLSNWKKKLLNKVEIWAVSQYTAEQIMRQQGVSQSQIIVLNNSLDPFFKPTGTLSKPDLLLAKYGLEARQQVLLTICRLSSTEQYKGYDMVIECLNQLIETHPDLVYLLVGKADEIELTRINQLITSFDLQQNIILTGFLPESELDLHYQLADVFIMPSKAEGFGLVFIEAAARGCAVIAGNTDGSRDALLNGGLGIMVNPNDKTEITQAIVTALQNGKQETVQKKCLAGFGYEAYKNKVTELLKQKDITTYD